jgi:hypothetical protein
MSIALDWPGQLQPVLTSDLADYAAAIASMWGEVEMFIDGNSDSDTIGWQALFDVDLCPLIALPWLAQCVGERLPVGIDEASSRDWIKLNPRWLRGTEQAIVNAVKRLLTGPATVQFGTRQHVDGTVDVDCIAVLTYASQTPDQVAVQRALRDNVPADIIWEYACVDIAIWSLVEAGMASWTQLQTTYGPKWSNVAGSQPGFNVW